MTQEFKNFSDEPDMHKKWFNPEMWDEGEEWDDEELELAE